MLSLHSELWTSGPSWRNSRRSSVGMPRQPSPKYSPVIKCLPNTQSFSSTTTSRLKSPKPFQRNSVTSHSLRSLHAAFLHRPTHRRWTKGPSGLAYSKRVNPPRPRKNTSTSPQTLQPEQNLPPTSRNTYFLPANESTVAMARKPIVAKRARGGRLVIKPLQSLPTGSTPSNQNSSEAQNTSSIDLAVTSDVVHTPSLTPQDHVQDQDTSSADSTPAENQPEAMPTTPVSSAGFPQSPTINPRALITNPTRAQHRSTGSLQKTKDNQVKNEPLSPKSLVSSRLSTPEDQIDQMKESSSELSTLSESIGSTPEGFKSPRKRHNSSEINNGSPIQRSMRTRQQAVKVVNNERARSAHENWEQPHNTDTDILSSTVNESESSSIGSRYTPSTSQSVSPLAHKRGITDSVYGTSHEGSQTSHIVKKPRLDATPSSMSNNSDSTVKPEVTGRRLRSAFTSQKRSYLEPEDEPTPSKSRSDKSWTRADRKKAIMHGSDTQTQNSPANTDAPRRGGRHNGRGGSRTSRGGSGNGRGRGGKHRVSGRGRDEDSPEPSHPRRTQTQEDALLIKHAKARQAELRRMFNMIGNHQTEILDIMASRDLTKIAKKAKAHRQVPEYEEVVEDLEDIQGLARENALKQYELDVQAENERFEAEKAAIENRFKIKKADLNEECQKGAQGDLIIFQRAVAAAHDETRTQDGSEADYFPRYHDFPEPDQSIRGYALSRITDEKPFKHHLRTYDDEARREVIDDDVRPIIQAFAQKNAERRAEEERKKSQTMEALSAVADKELEEIKNSLIPKPVWHEEDVNSFHLSCLADVAELMSRQYPQKHYSHVPFETGGSYPREVLTYDRFPDRNAEIPQPLHPEAPHSHNSVTTRSPPNSSLQSSRRSLRNLQPSGPFAQPIPPVQVSSSAEPSHVPLTSAVSTTSGPVLAPAPQKIAPAPPHQQSQPLRPPPIDTRLHNPTPPEQSPQTQTQTPTQGSQGLPPLQPRHMSQSSLPPPPPGYPYHPPYSPTHPPAGYPPHHGLPSPYQPVSAPPPYHHHQHPLPPPPSPYSQHPQTSYHQYGQSHYYPAPPNPPPQQQFSFMPPQQGPAPPQSSPAPRPHSRARSTAASLPPPPPPQDSYQNGYHHRAHSHTFQARVPVPSQAPPPPPPPHTTITTKSRARAKQKQPVTFVNQTLATRKAAAEQLAKEEAAAAAERKERDKDKDKKGSLSDKGRKLAPKVEPV